ncbi:hypothetical protein KPATCC21470_8526 [Kitasatospora purpeofusca]
MHRFSSVHGRSRLPVDHGAGRPPGASTVVILANWQDTAVERRGAARPQGFGRW